MLEFFEARACPICADVRQNMIPILRMKYQIEDYDVESDYKRKSVRMWKQVCSSKVPAIRIADRKTIPTWLVGREQILQLAKIVEKTAYQTLVRVHPYMSVV